MLMVDFPSTGPLACAAALFGQGASIRRLRPSPTPFLDLGLCSGNAGDHEEARPASPPHPGLHFVLPADTSQDRRRRPERIETVQPIATICRRLISTALLEPISLDTSLRRGRRALRHGSDPRTSRPSVLLARPPATSVG